MLGIIIDIETYCPLPLKNFRTHKGVGLYKYAEHPDTRVMCSSVVIFNSKFEIIRQECKPGLPDPSFFEGLDLSKHILIAHNANFERVMLRDWTDKIFKGKDNWFCTSSYAAQMGLPRKLGTVSLLLDLAQKKDIEKGDRVVGRLKEVAATKETSAHILCDLEYMRELIEYCLQDTLTTFELFKTLLAIQPFPKIEQKIYKLDQKINDRGFLIDYDTTLYIRDLVTNYNEKLNEQIQEMSEGKIKRISQYKILGELLENEGVKLPNFQKTTIDAALKQDDLTKRAFKLLSLKACGVQTSVKKYDALIRYACSDHRLRGLYIYYGAHTGRWSGVGPQPQNFPKLATKEGKPFTLTQFLEEAKRPEFNINFLNDAGSVSRYMLIPKKGKLLHVVDYANIEPRLLFWLTNCQQGLDDLKSDIYLKMASDIYGEPVTNKSDPRRFVGKVAVIAFGYGLQAKTFCSTCEDEYGLKGITLKFAEKMVQTYAKRFPEVKQAWYGTLKAAITALHNNTIEYGKMGFTLEKDYLCFHLPSGSTIRYFKPLYDFSPTSAKEWKQLTYIFKYGNRVSTHGGKIIENAIQRLARDVFAQGLLNLDKAGFNIVLHTHDEIVCEESTNRIEEMKHIMLQMPDWLRLPNGEPFVIPNEGGVCERYNK